MAANITNSPVNTITPNDSFEKEWDNLRTIETDSPKKPGIETQCLALEKRFTKVINCKGNTNEKYRSLKRIGNECFPIIRELLQKNEEANASKLENRQIRAERAMRENQELKRIINTVCECLEQDNLKQARLTLEEYLVDQSLSAETEPKQVEKKPKTACPVLYILPQTKQLAKQLAKLNDKLQMVMSNASDGKTDIPAHLREKRQEYAALSEKYEELVQPVARELEVIEDKVAAHANSSIPKEHISSIARFEKASPSQISHRLEQQEAINTSRKEQHDEMAEEWASVLLGKEAVQWQLERMEIFAMRLTNVQKHNEQLSKLKENVESFKDLVRDEQGHIKEEKKQKWFEQKRSEHSDYAQKYTSLTELSNSIRENTQGTIEKLRAQLIGESVPVKEALNAMVVYDGKTREVIDTTADQIIGQMQHEQESLLHKMEEEWDTFSTLLDTTNNQDSLAYAINRVGYAVHDNGGSIPLDMSYNWSLLNWFSWEPREDYAVYSPFENASVKE